MTRHMIGAALTAVASILPGAAMAQQHQGPDLHVNPRWEECAFQLDASLTQRAWRQFTREAAQVTYFRPMRGARPLGAGEFELSLLQTQSGIDDADAAWNDTFVHPDSAHWLFEGSGLKIPGLMVRGGVTDRLDVGAYVTKNPKSNYGFAGAQVQYNVVQQAHAGIDASARASAVTLFGPEDLSFTVYGVDLVASREIGVLSNRVSLSPYVGVSGYLSTSHEKSAVVALSDERVVGAQGMIGVSAQISAARIAFEYGVGSVSSRSIRVGVAF